MDKKEYNKQFSFWYWLFRYGLKKFLTPWLILQITLAYLCPYLINIKMDEAVVLIIVPLSGILIGLSFAWVGNAMALLESDEVKQLIKKHKVGLQDYIFTYQMAILLIIISIISWALVGLKVQENEYFILLPHWMKRAGEIYLFFITILSIRECWQIVMSTQWLLIIKSKVKDLIHKQGMEE